MPSGLMANRFGGGALFTAGNLDNADTASEYAFILETMHVKNAAEVCKRKIRPALGHSGTGR